LENIPCIANVSAGTAKINPKAASATNISAEASGNPSWQREVAKVGKVVNVGRAGRIPYAGKVGKVGRVGWVVKVEHVRAKVGKVSWVA
jgi:hypothetical protein